MEKNKRFKIIHKEGNGLTSLTVMVLMDTETGVHYLFTEAGYAGGLTALLDADGRPLVGEKMEQSL